jgi:hypothetical protein
MIVNCPPAQSPVLCRKDEVTMRMASSVLLTAFMFAFLTLISSAASDSPDTGKVAPNQGLTLEKIGRGVKSAAKNIEEEIPKIGPAIGDTFKKVTGSNNDQDPSKTHAQSSGKSKK